MAKLVEIKKGQTGRGLLIEHDGYMELTENDRHMIKEGMNGIEGGWHCPKPFIVSAVFQKFGIENANGRIYPENTLKREVERYQTKIQEHRAYGECYTEDAQCYTPYGWRLLKNLKEGEEVLTLNPKTLKTETNKIMKKIMHKVTKPIMHVKGQYIDDILTPNHEYPLFVLKDEKYVFDCFKKISDIELLADEEQEYFIPVSLDATSQLEEIHNLTFEKQDYNGKVYCIEVPNHIWYVKQNGKCHWTKNCNHPDDSVIDLGRVCMNITELHWVEHTLVGQMEIITSEAFRQDGTICCLGDTVANLLLSGLKIGVSSRAVGSVEQHFGKTIVGDDLELICWDVVSEPSTPSSWISMSYVDDIPQQYIESKDKKPVLSENLDKIESILKDF